MNWGIETVLRARINTANDLLNRINALRALATRPDRIWVEPRIEGAVAKFVGRVIEPPPVELSILLGELLYQLRASLENAIWYLAQEPREGQTGYPVCAEEGCWTERRTRNRYRSVPDVKCEYIRSRQPFALGNEFRSHPLWQLHEFAKQDRHRLVPAVATWNQSITFTTFYADSVPDSMPMIIRPRFADGDVVCTLRLTDWWRKGSRLADLKFDIDPSLPTGNPGRGRPFVSAAQEYLDWVQETLYGLLS